MRPIRLEIEGLQSFEKRQVIDFEKLTEYGLFGIFGETGSGKSTTLAAVVDLINESRNEHVITLEEPIEYTFESKKAHISQREVGLHTASYSAALRAALREDPDIIVVGELRDRETTSLAVTAAETGHLVFATLHTRGVKRNAKFVRLKEPLKTAGPISAKRPALTKTENLRIGLSTHPLLEMTRAKSLPPWR